MEYNSRGFAQFGEVRCTYNSSVRVFESSSAEGPHLWLSVQADLDVLTRAKPGQGSAHLSLAQTQDLHKMLGEAIEFMSRRFEEG